MMWLLEMLNLVVCLSLLGLGIAILLCAITAPVQTLRFVKRTLKYVYALIKGEVKSE